MERLEKTYTKQLRHRPPRGFSVASVDDVRNDSNDVMQGTRDDSLKNCSRYRKDDVRYGFDGFGDGSTDVRGGWTDVISHQSSAAQHRDSSVTTEQPQQQRSGDVVRRNPFSIDDILSRGDDSPTYGWIKSSAVWAPADRAPADRAPAVRAPSGRAERRGVTPPKAMGVVEKVKMAERGFEGGLSSGRRLPTFGQQTCSPVSSLRIFTGEVLRLLCYDFCFTTLFYDFCTGPTTFYR